MRVMLADIEVGALNAALAELKGQGIDAHGIRCDVADRASVQHAAKETFAALGKVHLVCSNAGVGCGGPLELITPESDHVNESSAQTVSRISWPHIGQV
jgi:NAD(P)-dependent dehydrogenase (short-subunit alcohol dehydrogenase family)